MIVNSPAPTDVSIRLRIPYWANGGSVKINGRTLPVFASPSSYLALRGPWKNGDTIELNLPMALHSSRMPDDDTVQAPMFGPLVLAARHENSPQDHWYGDAGTFGRERGAAPPPLPAANGKIEDSATWIEPVPNETLSFRTTGPSAQAQLVPINQIVHERYDVYWKVTPPRLRPTGEAK